MKKMPSRAGARGRGRAGVRSGATMTALPSTRYHCICRDAEGREVWRDTARNLVVDEGLNDLLNRYFKGSSYTAAHYVGLTDGTPTVADSDTLASHTGWVEVTDYTGNRKALTLGSVSGQSVDNSASPATFAIDDTATVGGFFIATVDTGTSGTLYGAAAFDEGDHEVLNGYTLEVTATLTTAAA